MPLRLAAVAALMLGLTAGAGAAQQAGGAGGQGQQKPAPAGYVVVSEAEVGVRVPLTGRAVAQNDTQLRPRVGGVITAILYTPGSVVKVGDPLFAIDPLSYETALATATAERERAKADLSAAETAFARAEKLRAASTTTEAAWEEAQVALLKARATLAEAQAAEKLAQAQLDWTTVRAPIAGVIGVPQVALGDLVTQNQSDPLTEIVQVDPIYLDLAEPYPARLKIEARIREGEIAAAAPKLALLLDGGRRIESDGRLISAGATVSESTGTRLLRFELANPSGLIAPGLFVHAEVTVGTQKAILVPQRAATRQRDGTLTAWVAADGKAEKRKLAEAGSEGNAWVITAGLAPGDWLLIDGTANLRDGQEVAPVLAEIDEQGVVRDATPAAAGN